MDHLKTADAVLFVAAGVLYYFEEAQVRTLLSKLVDRFPGCELVFDACSPRGQRIANKRVIQDGGMDQSAQLKWGDQESDRDREMGPADHSSTRVSDLSRIEKQLQPQGEVGNVPLRCAANHVDGSPAYGGRARDQGVTLVCRPNFSDHALEVRAQYFLDDRRRLPPF
jgi:hypothetical protein